MAEESRIPGIHGAKEKVRLAGAAHDHLIQPTSLPDHFPLDAQGQVNYLGPHVGSSRRSVAVDELLFTATAGEDESEPPPPPPMATETSIDILQPSQVISFATDEPSELSEIIDHPTDVVNIATRSPNTSSACPTTKNKTSWTFMTLSRSPKTSQSLRIHPLFRLIQDTTSDPEDQDSML